MPTDTPEEACKAACAKLGEVAICQEFSKGACLDRCAEAAKVPKDCENATRSYWECALHNDWTCKGNSGTEDTCKLKEADMEKCTSDCKYGGCYCMPNELFCDGDKLTKCSSDGATGTSFEDCASYGGKCADGKCTGGNPCAPEGPGCSGSDVINCKNKVATVTKKCTGLQICYDSACVTPCQAGTTTCQGSKLYKCNADGNGSSYYDDCTFKWQKCSQRKCVAGKAECEPVYLDGSVKCDDNNACKTGDQCDGKGVCAGTVSKDCDDKLDCTVDSCSPINGCFNDATDSKCDDGNVCTKDDCHVVNGCTQGLLDKCDGLVWGGSCYTWIDHAKDQSWAKAEKYCADWEDGHLVAITTQTENAQLQAWASKQMKASSYWIGLHLDGGVWKWSDGTALSYKNWAAGQPEASKNDALATMHKDGTWGAVPLTNYNVYKEFVCERPHVKPCDDGNGCTLNDLCDGKTCKSGGPACDDNNKCTADSCKAGKQADCTNKPMFGSPCDDGKACGTADACNAVGLCASTTQTNCDDGSVCTIDSCAEPDGCKHLSIEKLIGCADGKVCMGPMCKSEGPCGNGVLDALAEVCDDGNTKAGDGCSPTCTMEPGKSCAGLHKMFPALPDGVYSILPAAKAGAYQPLDLYCDMSGDGWTLVANIYDTAGDDVPNLPAAVTAGWQQVDSGKWKGVQKLTRDKVSGVVGLAFANAMAAWGAKNVRICLVHKDGKDSVCRTSPKDLTIGGLPGGSTILDPLAINAVTWTYGRLIGLPATAVTFDTGKLVSGAGCLPKTPGKLYEFGQVCANPDDQGFCESSAGKGWDGVWCANCQGTCFRPARTDGGELGVGAWKGQPEQLDPLPEAWGFRVYLGP